MLQISSNEKVPIIRQLDQPLDTATYYVQAKIYKALDNSLIKTINLTGLGGQLFTTTWEAISDVSGLGTYIYVQTKVYLDAGYSNISPNYGVQNDVYLVQNRPNAALLGGGGSMGYSNIDYEAFWKRIGARIQKLVDEALVLNKKEILKELEGVKSLAAAAKGKPFNYEILERIESLIPEGVSYEKIKSLLPIPADHRADLQYLASELQKIPAMVDHRNEIISLKAELNGLRNIVEKMMKATEDSTSTINTFKSKSQQIAKMKQLMSELHKTGEGVFDAAQTTEPEQLPGFMTYMKNKGFKS